MERKFATFTSEGFTAFAIELNDKSVLISKADADIDADGANGQNGAQAAYMVGNRGSELLANGGMAIVGGFVVGAQPWFKDIVILNDRREPRIFPGGIIASKTAYKWPTPDATDPAAYLDSEIVPYICVPPEIRDGVQGVVMGCKCRVRHRSTGKEWEGMVGDIGPRRKIGELSIAMAKGLGIPSSPRTGGEDRPLIDYIIYPGVFARLAGSLVPLQRKNGTYIIPTE